MIYHSALNLTSWVCPLHGLAMCSCCPALATGEKIKQDSDAYQQIGAHGQRGVVAMPAGGSSPPQNAVAGRRNA